MEGEGEGATARVDCWRCRRTAQVRKARGKNRARGEKAGRGGGVGGGRGGGGGGNDWLSHGTISPPSMLSAPGPFSVSLLPFPPNVFHSHHGRSRTLWSSNTYFPP